MLGYVSVCACLAVVIVNDFGVSRIDVGNLFIAMILNHTIIMYI